MQLLNPLSPVLPLSCPEYVVMCWSAGLLVALGLLEYTDPGMLLSDICFRQLRIRCQRAYRFGPQVRP